MQTTIYSNEKESRLVSVIIPTYNRSDLLAEAVNSVYAQSYRPIECIVVDDGSKDNTDEVMKQLAVLNESSFSLVYLKQLNSGAQTARNNGTKAASGAYIQYLDSDDLLYANKIEQQVKFLENNQQCDGVFGDWQVGSKEKNTTTKAYKSDDLVTQFLTQKCIANFSFLMRVNMIKKIGDWDITVKRNQEIDFHLKGVLAGGQFEYEPLMCGLWRTHDGERIGNSTQFTSAIHFYQKWEKLLREKNIWSAKISEGISNNYIWFLNEYPGSNNKELQKLLFEIKRLNPRHSIFNSKKYKIIRLFAGARMANSAWIKVYKRKANG